MKRNNKKGFTIVELVIVIAIIAILAAVLIPTFANLVKRSKVSADTQLVRNLNTALVTDSASKGNAKHATMGAALAAAAEAGYDVDRINKSATDNEILWDSENDLFCYFDAESNKINYIPDFTPASTPADEKYWVISKTQSDKYSTYYTGTETKITVDSARGFAAGVDTVETITVTYAGEVIVETKGGTLVINNENAVVYHYGTAEVVDIKEVKDSSYHENGKAIFLKIAKGRVIVEETAEIGGIYLVATENEYTGIKLAVVGKAELPAVSRADVTLANAEKKLVVEVQALNASNAATAEKTEYIYIFGDANGEATAKVTSDADGNTEVATATATAAAVKTAVEDAKSESTAASDAETTIIANEAGVSFEGKVARIGSKGYDTFAEAVSDVNVDEVVTLLTDIDLVNEYGFKKSATIDGAGHSIRASAATGGYGSAREGRVFDVSDVSNITLKFINLAIIGEDRGVRGISLYGTSNVTLIMENCSVTANYYAINVASANTNLKVTLNRNTMSTGWCAIQSWSPNAIFDITDCVLSGINNKAYSADGWNNFSTIVINSSATNNVWNITNTKIYGEQTTGNKQTLLSFRSSNTIMNLNGCEFYSDGVKAEGNIMEEWSKYLTFTSQEAIDTLTLVLDNEVLMQPSAD